MGIDPRSGTPATMSTSMGDLVIALDAVKAPVDRQQLRVPRPPPLLRRRHLPPHHQRLRVSGRSTPTATAGAVPVPFADELPKAGQYEIGSLAMANAGPDTNGSQFFLISGKSGAQLPPQYSLFGKVVKGLEIVDAMQRVPTGGGDRPKTDVVINSVTITVAD
jgi:cyclophilin family peptidyl-prolyl cis-trans isomerase